MLSRFCVLLGALFAVAPLSAHSQSPESPERVAENYVKAGLEGRDAEAILKYGSNATIDMLAQAMWEDKKTARPALECFVVRRCTQKEWETLLMKGGASEKELLEFRKSWQQLDKATQEMKKSLEKQRENKSARLQKQGGLDSISTTLVSQTADTAQVRLEIKYKNGEHNPVPALVTLVKEAGEWKTESIIPLHAQSRGSPARE